MPQPFLLGVLSPAAGLSLITPLASIVLAAPAPTVSFNPWVSLLPALLAAVTIAMLLPNPKSSAAVAGGGAVLGVLTLLLMGLLWTKPGSNIIDAVLFYLFAGVAVVSGTLLVTHHNPVRAALSFVLVVLSVCGLFLLQAAPFLMAATIIVYAGAIVVTFLFVIMLAQQLGQSNADLRTHELVCSSIAGAAMLATLVVVLMQTDSAQGLQSLQTFPTTEATLLVQRTRTAAGMSEPAKIVAALEDDGATLFDDYRRLGEADRGSQAARSLLTYVREHQTEWDDAKKRQLGTDLQRLLGELAEKGSAVVAGHTADGKSMMPAENTAALGVSLFTDYFLAVELAGSLLLIATVGAIAVTARRPDAVAVASPVSNHFAGRAGGQV